MTKVTLVADVETYRNYFLLGFRRVDNGVTRYFERCDDRDWYLDTHAILTIMRSYKIVTFNGRTYDLPMIVAALRGLNNETLKKISDHIIQRNIKWWDVERELGIVVPPEWDHIDLSEPAPGVRIPLKLYGARMHSKRLQDLPVSPDAELTDEQIETLRDYNLNNDLPMTVDLWNALQGDIELREHMTARYRVDMRSKSGAQIAEAIIKSEVKKVVGGYIPDPKIDMDRKLKFVPPAFLKFKTEQLQNLFKKICDTEFEIASSGAAKIPSSLTNAKVRMGKNVYKLGIGGLHSQEKAQTLYAGEGHEIHDDDVVSFYPSIILVTQLFPPNMGRAFLEVFRDIFKERVVAKERATRLAEIKDPTPQQLRELKDAKMRADTGKLASNSCFGKFSNLYSKIYSPQNHLAVVLTGQLSLLMLIEWLEEAGISVVSANTDGIVTMFPKSLLDTKVRLIKAWERATGFITENTQYRAIHSRDVNNYVAITTKGKVKLKGVFAAPGLMKNPQCQISTEAVVKYLADGIPIRETVESCTDIRKFIDARRVSGGAKHGDNLLGRVVRSYKSIFATEKIVYAEGKKAGHKVPDTDPVQPIMTIPDEFPWDVDYEYYIQRAEKMLVLVGAKNGKAEEVDVEWDSQPELLE